MHVPVKCIINSYKYSSCLDIRCCPKELWQSNSETAGQFRPIWTVYRETTPCSILHSNGMLEIAVAYKNVTN